MNCIRFPIKCCINGENVIRLLYLSAKLFKFEIQKCSQILCAHKPYFLMPGHIYIWGSMKMSIIARQKLENAKKDNEQIEWWKSID